MNREERDRKDQGQTAEDHDLENQVLPHVTAPSHHGSSAPRVVSVIGTTRQPSTLILYHAKYLASLTDGDPASHAGAHTATRNRAGSPEV